MINLGLNGKNLRNKIFLSLSRGYIYKFLNLPTYSPKKCTIRFNHSFSDSDSKTFSIYSITTAKLSIIRLLLRKLIDAPISREWNHFESQKNSYGLVTYNKSLNFLLSVLFLETKIVQKY